MPKSIRTTGHYSHGNGYENDILNPTGDSDRFAAVNKNTGENAGDLQFGRRVKVDKTHFQILCRRRANVPRAEKSRNQGFHGHLSTFA